jgi:hypothetical protein
MSKVKIGEQIAAARKAVAFVDGSERPPSVARERDYLTACLRATVATLEAVRDCEEEVRAVIKAKKGGAQQ